MTPGGHLTVLTAHDTGQRQDAGAVVGDEQVLGVQGPVDVVEGGEPLPRARAADHDGAVEGGQVEGVQRLTERQHDVVGDVHGQPDRAHPGLGEPPRHPLRGGPGEVDTAHDPREVAVAARHPLERRIVGEADGIPLFLTLVHGQRRRVGVGRAGGVGVLPRDAADREAVATVGGDVDLDRLAVQAEHPDEVVTRGEPGDDRLRQQAWEHEDPVVVLPDPELADRADHPGRDVAVGLAGADRQGSLRGRQRAAGQDHRDEVADAEVVRPADDALRLAGAVGVAHVDLAPVDRLAVLLLLGRHLQDAPDDERAADAAGVQSLLLEPHGHEVGGDLLAGDPFGQRDVVAQPVDRNPHQISIPNCALKRTSPSIISRMSAIPCRNIAVRSTPIPKAKPW